MNTKSKKMPANAVSGVRGEDTKWEEQQQQEEEEHQCYVSLSSQVGGA